MHDDEGGSVGHTANTRIPTGNQIALVVVCRNDGRKPSHACALLVAVNAPSVLDVGCVLLDDGRLELVYIHYIVIRPRNPIEAQTRRSHKRP